MRLVQILAAVLVVAVFSRLFFDGRTSFILALVAALPLPAVVILTARRWLDLLDIPVIERHTPASIDRKGERLAQEGFDPPIFWTAGTANGLSALSADGTVIASFSAYRDGPVLTTRWDAAQLQTSQSLVAPLTENLHTQTSKNAGMSSLLAVHREAIAFLNQSHGIPLQLERLTIADIDRQRVRLRSSLAESPYRHSVRGMLASLESIPDRVALREGLPVWVRYTPASAMVPLLVGLWTLRDTPILVLLSAILSYFLFMVGLAQIGRHSRELPESPLKPKSFDQSRTSQKAALIPLLVIVCAFGPLVTAGRWWGWVMLGIGLAILWIIVHVISRQWLDTFETSGVERDTAAAIDDEEALLGPAGFTNPVRWTAGDQEGFSARSHNGVIGVAFSTDREGPDLVTRWGTAVLTTSSVVRPVLDKHHYTQTHPHDDLLDLVDAHRDAIEVLNRRYGPPRRLEQVTMADLNGLQAERRATFAKRRRRETARALVISAVGGSRPHLARRLDPRYPALAPVLLGLALASSVVFIWIAALSETPGFALAGTYLQIAVIAALFFKARRQLQFRKRSSD